MEIFKLFPASHRLYVRGTDEKECPKTKSKNYTVLYTVVERIFIIIIITFVSIVFTKAVWYTFLRCSLPVPFALAAMIESGVALCKTEDVKLRYIHCTLEMLIATCYGSVIISLYTNITFPP